MKFKLEKTDTQSAARSGQLHTAHGKVQTPVFMPVGTQASVKTASPEDLEQAGARIILGNTYHLYLRPGHRLIEESGGLQSFMSWPHPILTDSGGFQVFSLAELRKINDEGVRFQSHIDGSYHTFTPELVVDIQRSLGSDIMMVLDECAPFPCTHEYALKANERTVRWAERSITHFRATKPPLGKEQALFGIVQGSTYEDVRRQSMQQLLKMDFDGYAVGGLAVGEPKSAMMNITQLCGDLLPKHKPRYLMGVGKPEDIVHAISLGMDMFDCVIPTRNARNGTVFTWIGRLVLKNSQYEKDFQPIDASCPCYTCRTFSRAYLRHLFQAQEILGLRLATIHNITFYMQIVKNAREAIQKGIFEEWKNQFLNNYQMTEQV